MGMFLHYDVTTASIEYGSVDVDNDSLEKITTIETTGNIGMDVAVSGGVNSPGFYGLCDTYPACTVNTILTNQQHYNLTQAQGWGAGAELSFTATEIEANIPKTYYDGTFHVGSKNTYWYLHIPDGTTADIYEGQNIIAGVTGESVSW